MPKQHKPPILISERLADADLRETATDRFCELLDTLASEPDIRPLLMVILEAKAAPDDQPAQLLKLSYLLAEVMENPFTPGRLYNVIADELNDIRSEYEESGRQERDLRAGLFVPALAVCNREEATKVS